MSGTASALPCPYTPHKPPGKACDAPRLAQRKYPAMKRGIGRQTPDKGDGFVYGFVTGFRQIRRHKESRGFLFLFKSCGLFNGVVLCFGGGGGLFCGDHLIAWEQVFLDKEILRDEMVNSVQG